MGCGASKTPVVEEANKPTKAEPAADAGKASTSPAAPAAKAGTPAKSAASPAAKGGGATGSTPVVPLVPAAKGGAVIFCLGNEACGKEEICAKVAAEVGGSYLLATDLLRDAVESGSDEGNQLAEMIKQGKIVPASMTTALLTAAMADKPAPYLVDGFPSRSTTSAPSRRPSARARSGSTLSCPTTRRAPRCWRRARRPS